MTLDKQAVVIQGLRNDGCWEIPTRAKNSRCFKWVSPTADLEEFWFVNKNGNTWAGTDNRIGKAEYWPQTGRYLLNRAATRGY